MIGALLTAVLLGATTHDIVTTPSNTYSPQGLRVSVGDTVRWEASDFHPLVFDDDPGVQYMSMQQRTLNAAGHVRFHCNVHGATGGGGMSGVVAVGDANTAPTIAVQRDTAVPVAGQPVAFRAIASDPERLPLRIDWDMDGDGTFELAGAGTNASATYQPGTRTVRAQAIDDLGMTASAAHTFTVPAAGPAPAQPPAPGAPAPAGTLPPDTLAPAVSVSAPRTISARRLRRRGVLVSLTPSEDGQLVVELRSRAGRRLARATAQARARRTTLLRVRARRARPGRFTLRVVAIDLAGNRTTIKRRLTAKAAG